MSRHLPCAGRVLLCVGIAALLACDTGGAASATVDGGPDSEDGGESAGPCTGPHVFADPVLEAKVRKLLEIPEGDALTASALAKLETLAVPMGPETSLEGVQCLTALRWIKLWPDAGSTNPARYPVPDLTPLAALEHLFSISIQHTTGPVPRIPPIASLTGLSLEDTELEDASIVGEHANVDTLHISNNRISDLSFLAGLPKLVFLNASTNAVADLGPLAGLADLEVLLLADNVVEDLSPLGTLDRLQVLELARNPLRDVEALARLVSLEGVDLDETGIDRLPDLSDLRRLLEIHASDNELSDLSPLAGLRATASLYLDRNRIADLSPIAALPLLTRLEARDNLVSDLSPLIDTPSLETLFLERNRVDCEVQAPNIAAILANICRIEGGEQVAWVSVGCSEREVCP